MNYKTINSFSPVDININENESTLVLCDIDETLLKFKHENEYINKKWWEKVFEHYYRWTGNYNYAEKLAYEEWNKIIDKIIPEYTDKDGFEAMLNKLQNGHGNDRSITFVTARKQNCEELTMKHLQAVNKNLLDHKVLFCGDESKGICIKNSIDLTKYKKVIFIDDLVSNIDDVYEVFGNRIEYYLFII